ncbi:hypothetical protein ACROYT_G000456 [Oculina patagonica]
MGHSTHRLAFQRLFRLICPESSTNCLIPSRRPEINGSLKRQLSYLNSKCVERQSLYSGISSTSAQQSKVIQGHRLSPFPFAENVTVCRSYSSVEHGCSQNLNIDKANKEGQMGDIEASSVSVPNDTWTAESCELHKKLTSDLIEHGNGNWSKHKSSVYHGERRLFTKALVAEYPGKFFEYEFFFSKKEQRLKGVIQFGPYTQGPPGCVHGGASAAMMDSAIGVCVNKAFSHCVTASLSMNYKSFLPLGTTTMVESWVEKVEGRKIFGTAELKSPDGKVTYVTANALFIQLDPEGKNKNVRHEMEKQSGKQN